MLVCGVGCILFREKLEETYNPKDIPVSFSNRPNIHQPTPDEHMMANYNPPNEL